MIPVSVRGFPMRKVRYLLIFFSLLLPQFIYAEEQTRDFSHVKEILFQASQEALASDNSEKRPREGLGAFFRVPVTEKVELLGKIGLAQTIIGDSLAPTTFLQALAIAKEIKDEEVRQSAFEEIAKLQARAGDVKSAFQTTSLIVDSYSKAISLSQIASAYIAAGNREEARHILILAFLSIWPITEFSTIHSGIVTALARIGETNVAEIFLEELDSRIRIGPLHEIARTKLAEGDRKGAMHAFSRISQGNNAQVLHEIGTDQAKRGKMKEARKTLNEALEAARSEKNDWALSSIVESLVRDGFTEDAIAVVDFIEGPVIISVMRTIAEQQMQAGDRVAAKSTLAQLKEKLKKRDQRSIFSQRNADYAMIAMGILDTVDMVVDEIRDKPDEWYRLHAIIEAQAHAGDIQGALRTYQIYIEGEGDRSMASDALAQIAAAQARSGDLIAAKETFRRAVENEEKRKDDCCPGFIQKLIARTQAGVGDVEGALFWASRQDTPFVRAESLFGIALGVLDQSNIKLPQLPELFPESDHSMVFRSPE